MGDRYDAGMRVRREVLGDAHVNRAETKKTTFALAQQVLDALESSDE